MAEGSGMDEQSVDRSRRAFLTKVVYTAPLIVTLSVMPSIASAGSPVITKTIESQDGVQPLRVGGHHHNNWHWR